MNLKLWSYVQIFVILTLNAAYIIVYLYLVVYLIVYCPINNMVYDEIIYDKNISYIIIVICL